MAEGFLKSLDSSLDVFSAGTNPAQRVNQHAVNVMNEIGIDISKGHPKKVDEFVDRSFDYVITVCDNAKETCPVFTGNVKHKLHISFDDPADAIGNEEEVLPVYRRVRNEMVEEFSAFYKKIIREL